MKHCASDAARRRSPALVAAPALAQTAPPPAISVTGEATVSVPPDLAQIDGGVTYRRQDRARGVRGQQRRDGQGAAGAEGAPASRTRTIQTSRLSLQPQYAAEPPAARSAITGYRASNRVTVRLRDVSQGRQRDRHAGRRRRQRDRRHQFHGAAGLEAARRGAREGDRGRPPQGRDLRPRRRRHARRAAQHFRGRRRRRRCPIRGRMAVGHGRGGAGGAGRRDAVGHGQRVLGDQGAA